MSESLVTYRIGGEVWPEAGTGGKADGLHRAARSGLNVPAGFCVTAEAFERAVYSLATTATTLSELRTALRETRLPEGLRSEVRDHLEEIRAPRWVVRSSATEEDSEARSFAGQYRTEVDVEGFEEVCRSIREVWAGTYDLEAMLYRRRVRVDAEPTAMSVVVQAMVDVEVGGVMFTRHPTRAEEQKGANRMVVGAARSSVEEIVSGRSGEHLEVDRSNGRVVGEAPSHLESERIDDLVDLADRIEWTFGGPRDVEWAFGRTSAGRNRDAPVLYALQVRPITGSDTGEGCVWSNANVGEALPGVGTPLTWSIIASFSRRGFERAFATLGLEVPEQRDLVGSFRGRVYLNLTEFVSIADAVPFVDPAILHEMAGGGGVDEVERTVDGEATRTFLRRLPATVARISVSQLGMPLVAPFWSFYFDRRVETIEERELDELDRSGLQSVFREIDLLFDRNGLMTLTSSSNFLMSYVAMRTAAGWFGSRRLAKRIQELVGALDVSSAEPGLELLRLGVRARRNPAVRKILLEHAPSDALDELRDRRDEPEVAQFVEAIEAFQSEHGHRAPREAELSTPRWRENTEFLLGVVQNYARAEDLDRPADYERTRREKRRAFDDRIDAAFGPVGAFLFRLVSKWARMTARLREEMRSRVVRTLDLYRRIALAIGGRLVDADIAADPEDVFYLRHGELVDWLEGSGDRARFRLRILIRRAVVDRLSELPDPPNTFVHRGGELVPPQESAVEPSSPTEPEDVRRIVDGLSASRGVVTGPARVVEDPDDVDHLEPGDILVAPHADVGWTPLFLTASGVVTGLGGPLSHASIVAREYGLPSVVNATGITEAIETGDLVTVDGDEGRVLIHR